MPWDDSGDETLAKVATFDRDEENELMSYLCKDVGVDPMPSSDVDEEEEHLFLDPMDPMTYPDEQENADEAEVDFTKVCRICGNTTNLYNSYR